MTTRTPGKRGRLPVKPPEIRFPLAHLHQYVDLPAAKYPVDVTGAIGDHDWQMLGNDQYGDCGFAGREHYQMAKAAVYGERETFESADDLVAEYLKYNHGRDVGVNLADALLTWYRQGKILAFAPVDHKSPAKMDAAMQAFKGLYCGVSLTDDADQLFSDGQPWNTDHGQKPDPAEGHCIVKAKADGHTLDEYVTWGALQPATIRWSAACLDEAWVAIMHEDEAAKLGAGYDKLRAAIDALHGTGGH